MTVMGMQQIIALLLTLILLLATGDGSLAISTPSATVRTTCAALDHSVGFDYHHCVGLLSADPASAAAKDARELAVVATNLTVANVTSILFVLDDLVKNLGECLRIYRRMNKTLEAVLGDLRAEHNIPCTIRDSLKHIAGGFFNFKAYDKRYCLQVYKGYKTTVMGGNDWAKFVSDLNLGDDSFVVFDTSKRSAVAYVAHLGSMHDVPDEDEASKGDGVDILNTESDDEELIDEDEEVAAPELVYTYGCVLSDDERSLLDVVLSNNDGYIGSFFIHRMTTTNISRKIMKIPRKVAQQLNLPLVGVVGICIGAGECMNVAYHTDCDGRVVFKNQWGVFAS
ncbi:putative invertase inhibitor [Hordeum vulgare]|nr:putative invertase inhibitor [Hordeum vulgare]